MREIVIHSGLAMQKRAEIRIVPGKAAGCAAPLLTAIRKGFCELMCDINKFVPCPAVVGNVNARFLKQCFVDKGCIYAATVRQAIVFRGAVILFNTELLGQRAVAAHIKIVLADQTAERGEHAFCKEIGIFVDPVDTDDVNVFLC